MSPILIIIGVDLNRVVSNQIFNRWNMLEQVIRRDVFDSCVFEGWVLFRSRPQRLPLVERLKLIKLLQVLRWRLSVHIVHECLRGLTAWMVPQSDRLQLRFIYIMWPSSFGIDWHSVWFPLGIKRLLLWCPINDIERIICHKRLHDCDMKQLLAQFWCIFPFKTCLDLYLGQQELTLLSNIIKRALNKLPLGAHIHLLGYECRHLIEIIDCLLTGSAPHLNLVLPKKDLQSHIFDCLSVETFNLGNHLFFPVFDLIEY